MPQQKTRGNPNLGRKTNAPTSAVINSTPTANVFAPIADIPNSANVTTPPPISSNPAAPSPTAPTIVVVPRSSNLMAGPMEVVEKEYFGRDKDLKTLLKHLQPKVFKREGVDIPKILEEWIISMDDYFALANYNSIAQGIMGRAKLEGSAKLWWKLHYQTQGKMENSIRWDELKKSLRQ